MEVLLLLSARQRRLICGARGARQHNPKNQMQSEQSETGWSERSPATGDAAAPPVAPSASAFIAQPPVAGEVDIATLSPGDSVQARRQTSHSTMTLLAIDFKPGANDVVCGRGKRCYSHVGNENFKRRVEAMLDDYAKAKSKLDKSGVLASLVDQIRAASPNGGFVKQDESGRWFEVGDFLAREKTSQAFRDALHERYKSSNVAKKKRRQEEQARAHDKFRRMARTYSDDSATAARLEWLSLGDSRMTGLPASDPRFQMYAQRQGMDAAARLSRLADMRQRLNSRYGASGNVGSTASSSRPSSAMSQLIHRYPDPLLGPTSSTSVGLGAPGSASLNAFPARVSSSFDNADAYGGEIDLNDLMAARRLEETDDEYSVRTEVSMMHHSMPNIHMGVAGSGSTSGGGRDTWNPYNVEVEPSLHYSAPDLMCSEAFHRSAPNLKYGGGTEEGDEGEESMSNDMDPIPLDQYTPKPFPKRRLGADDFKKPISMALSPTSPSTEAVSRDLLACLEKLTGSSIKDENPFEPLPLDPGTSSARAASAPSSSSAAQVRHEPMDAQRVTRDKKPSPFESHGKLTPPPPFS